jgi:hypothetical protein
MTVNIIQTITNTMEIPDEVGHSIVAVADYLDETDLWPNINNGEWDLLDVEFLEEVDAP